MHKTATGVVEVPKDSAEPPQISDGFDYTWQASSSHVLADGEPGFPDGRFAVARVQVCLRVGCATA
jgi:hypothetical protein